MALAGVTGGELIVQDTRPDDLRMIRLVFGRLGLRSEKRGNDIIVPGNQELRVQNDQGDHIPKVQDGPWPAFPADLTSIALALATQAEGQCPDPRVDVREPVVLLGKAAWGWAPRSLSVTRIGRSSLGGPAGRRSGWSRRTTREGMGADGGVCAEGR